VEGPKVDPTTLSRLAFIRYLYTVGLQQSRQPEPLNSSAILTLHDSVELFLQLASEFLNAHPKANQDFNGYWDILRPHVPNGGQLTQKESMGRLNEARAGLKHRGIWPNKGVIDGLTVSVTAFFDENTTTVFGVKFDELSMVDLVRYPKTRKNLKEAEALVSKNELHQAIEKIAIGFVHLIDEYEETKRSRHGRSPFFFGESVHFPHDLAADRSFDNMRASIEALQDAMKILSLGIDYKRYTMFRLYTPAVLPVIGNPTVQWINTPGPELQTCKSCLDFVVESAIQLQSGDYEPQPEPADAKEPANEPTWDEAPKSA